MLRGIDRKQYASGHGWSVEGIPGETNVTFVGGRGRKAVANDITTTKTKDLIHRSR